MPMMFGLRALLCDDAWLGVLLCECLVRLMLMMLGSGCFFAVVGAADADDWTGRVSFWDMLGLLELLCQAGCRRC